MISIDDAMQLLLEATPVLGIEEVSLADACGRVLTENVFTDRELPPTDRSAMDGFAVRSADLSGERSILRVVGEIRAGQPLEAIRVGRGEAVRIMTGAIVPPGADAVVMVEVTEEDTASKAVHIMKLPKPGQHIRWKGEDVEAGTVILEDGMPIDAPEIAALAAVGKVIVKVRRRPVVSILTTGDEVVHPAGTPGEHQVRNSNSSTLVAQLAGMGIEGRDLGVASDTGDALDRALSEAVDGDVLLMTGGVSMGRYDLVGDALERAGMELLFHKISVKPGKPILAGRCGRCLVVGLAGNPVSAFTGFVLLVAPVLRKMLGYRHWNNNEVSATLIEPCRGSKGRTTYLLARVEFRDGRYVAVPVRSSGSGDVVSMARANAFLICPGGLRQMAAGTEFQALLWADSWLRPAITRGVTHE